MIVQLLAMVRVGKLERRYDRIAVLKFAFTVHAVDFLLTKHNIVAEVAKVLFSFWSKYLSHCVVECLLTGSKNQLAVITALSFLKNLVRC